MSWSPEELSGLTLGEAMEAYERLGYHAQFMPREEGEIECLSCRDVQPASAFGVDMKVRIDEETDVSAGSFVAAMRCPSCGARGTATIPYGPAASAAEAEILRALNDKRVPTGWRRMVEDQQAPTATERGAQPLGADEREFEA